MLALFVLAAAGAAQACQDKGASGAVTAASQVAGVPHRAQIVHRTVLRVEPTGKQMLAAEMQAKAAPIALHCCTDVRGGCHGHGCGSSCCVACFTALQPGGFTMIPVVGMRADFMRAQNLLHSAESDTQFRPPRSLL